MIVLQTHSILLLIKVQGNAMCRNSDVKHDPINLKFMFSINLLWPPVGGAQPLFTSIHIQVQYTRQTKVKTLSCPTYSGAISTVKPWYQPSAA